MSNKILVIVPVYNCAKHIMRLLENLPLEFREYVDTLLVINNQSLDNTEEAAKEGLERVSDIKCVLLTNKQNYGYGGSLKIGFEFAIRNNFDWVIVINGDDQSPLSDFIPMLRSEEYKNNDVMWGSRFLKGSTLKNYSIARIAANYIFNFIFSLAVKELMHDIGCGVWMYSTRVLKEQIYKNMPDVLYIGSFLRLAHNFYQHKLVEFPLNWSSDDQKSTVRIFSQTFANFKLAFGYLLDKKRFMKKMSERSKIETYISTFKFNNTQENYGADSHGNFVSVV